MNTASPSPDEHRPPAERRRRWAKRREFNRAFGLDAVIAADSLTFDPTTYRHTTVCRCVSALADHQSAGPVPAAIRSPRHRSPKEVIS